MIRVKHWWLKLRYQYLLYRYQALGAGLEDKRCLRDVIKLLHPVDFAAYRSELGHGRVFTLLYESIGAMTARLKDMADHILEEEPFPREWFTVPAQEVALDHWLSVHAGFYVKPEAQLAAFQTQALRLLDLAIKAQGQKNGTQAYNLRVSRSAFQNLQEVSASLILLNLECLAAD